MLVSVGSKLVMNWRNHPELPWALGAKPNCCTELPEEMVLKGGKHIKVVKYVSHVGNKYRTKFANGVWDRDKAPGSSCSLLKLRVCTAFWRSLCFPSGGCPDRAGEPSASQLVRQKVPTGKLLCLFACGACQSLQPKDGMWGSTGKDREGENREKRNAHREGFIVRSFLCCPLVCVKVHPCSGVVWTRSSGVQTNT